MVIQKKSSKEAKQNNKVVVWVDQNIFATTKRVGKTVLNLFTESTVKLVTLRNISDLKTFYKHLFMIRYKQRTEEVLREYCIIIFNDFKRMKDILDYSELVDYFKENDLFIHTAIYAEHIDKTALSFLRKVEDRLVLLTNSSQLSGFIKDPEENKEKMTANSEFNDTEQNSFLE